MMKKLLTVFTPAYNRAHLLPRLYDALLRQTCEDFVWLVIDDGSSDNTRELVEGWIAEGELTIQYHYKENGGMHTAHNAAYDLIETELNVCIDSDDHMPVDAVEIILQTWERSRDDSLAGLVGLDHDTKGSLIGTQFKPDERRITLSGFYAHGGRGDKKLVLRTDVVNQYPRYPEYEGEKLVPLGTLYTLIDQDYELLTVNRPLVIVDYQEGGSSSTIFRQYRESPRGFSYARIVDMRYGVGLKKRFTSAVHFVSSSIYEKNINCLSNCPKKGMIPLAVIPGVLLNLYIRMKTREPSVQE